jgi:hypothetical protein
VVGLAHGNAAAQNEHVVPGEQFAQPGLEQCRVIEQMLVGGVRKVLPRQHGDERRAI